MAEGSISKFFADRGFGFIKQDNGGKDLFFHIDVVEGLSAQQIVSGVRVAYESESSARGPRASIVRPSVGQVKSPPASSPTQTPVAQRQGRYRFLNPYNFVRSLEVNDPTAAPILGRATPPPHDRYTGLTGQLKCKLTTITPLFVADTEEVIADPEHPGHYNYRFFQYGGKPAIPATSLRGAIRSVYEAATNSCYAIFDADKRLSYRLQPGEALKLVPARAIEKNGTWHLELLPGDTRLAIGQPPQGAQYAAWVLAYKPMRASGTVRNVPNSDYARRSAVSLTGWEHNEPCQAIVEKVKHPRRGFEFWNVVALAKPGASLPRPTGSQRLIQGYMCVTNQNIDNKHDERVFFYTSKSPVQIPLGNEERKRYNELVADYQERHADEVNKRSHPDRPQGRDPGLSWFTYQRLHEENKLHNGDLVYAMLKQDTRGVYLDFIVPVSVARLGYDQTIGERLDPGMPTEESLSHTCQKYDALCPACRVFGWVHQDAPADTDVPVAYAGRVRFSYAQKLSGDVIQEEILAVLSTPKPTTTRFYLRPVNNERPRKDREDGEVGYDASARQKLRGRKFYRHQGAQLAAREYRRAGRIKNDQNRTVREIQAPDSVFEFSVNFENLTPVELGALLWSLELEGWHHRLGMAKPLGFGSVKIEIEALEIVNPETRYSSLDSGMSPCTTDQKVGYIDQFERAMAARYGKDFINLDNIRDLKALLAESPQIPVHYPRASREPDPEGRNFEWFMGNKRSGRDAGPRIELPLAVDDHEGLPLIDKRGEEIS